MRLVLLGPPGAGKGTQAQRLATRFSAPHISTGDILRRSIELATPTGVEAKGFVDRGELVPFDIILRLVKDRLREDDAQQSWILDGFPRNTDQANAFSEILTELGVDADHVVYFDVPEQAVVDRLSGRRTCRDCGAVFHLRFSPPKQDGTCDKCGEHDLYQRTDDTEEAILNRLQVYAKETQPLVGYYEDQGRLLRIDASSPPDEVAAALADAL